MLLQIWRFDIFLWIIKRLIFYNFPRNIGPVKTVMLKNPDSKGETKICYIGEMVFFREQLLNVN